MSSEDDVEVRFGATTDALADGVKKAVSTVTSGVAEMTKSLTGLQLAGKGAIGILAGLAAAVATGALFKAAIRESVELGEQVGKLSRQFNLTTGEASNLAFAIDDAFLSVDEFIGISNRLTRQLKSNEDGIAALGIKTRDSKGALLGQTELMMSALDTIRQYKAGTDQLAAAQAAFGRGITEDVLQKLFDAQDAYAATKGKADEMGRTMGQENVQAALEFKRAQDNLGDSFQGIRVQIGNALIPVFSDWMSVMTDGVKTVIPSFGAATRGLAVALLFLTQVAGGIFQVIKTIFLNVGQFVAGIFAVITGFKENGIEGAKAAFGAMTEDMKGTWEDASATIEERARKLQKTMQEVWNGADASKKDDRGPNRSGTKSFVAPGEAAKQLEEFKRHLELLKLQEGDYHEFSKQAEVDYWESKLKVFAKGSKEWQSVQILYLQARRAAAAEGVAIAREELQLQQDAAGQDTSTKLALASKWADKMRELYTEDSEQYRAALREKLQAERAFNEQVRQFADIRARALLQARQTELDTDRAMVDLRLSMGEISKDQAIELQRALVQQKSQLDLEELQRREVLYKDDLVQQQNIAAEKVALYAKLNADLASLDRDQRYAAFQSWNDIAGQIASTTVNVLNGLLSRTMSWRQAMQTVVANVLTYFTNLGAQKLQQWIVSELLMTNVTKAATAARTGIAASGSVAAASAKTAEADVVITANAGEAASGAAASQAAIPVIGPALAAAAAAAIFAMVLGFKGAGGSMPSAAGGWWEVPSDTMALIHRKEMVMPAPLAEGVREMVENGGSLGGSPQLHVHAMDAEDVKRFLHKHADSLYDVMRGKLKSFPRG